MVIEGLDYPRKTRADVRHVGRHIHPPGAFLHPNAIMDAEPRGILHSLGELLIADAYNLGILDDCVIGQDRGDIVRESISPGRLVADCDFHEDDSRIPRIELL